jgi:hypothetical protein
LIPVFYLFNKTAGMNGAHDSTYSSFSLGALGFSGTTCIQQYAVLPVERAFTCGPTSRIHSLDSWGLVPSTMSPPNEEDPLSLTNINEINDLTSYCGDSQLGNDYDGPEISGNNNVQYKGQSYEEYPEVYSCSYGFFKENEFTDDFNTKCLTQNECSLEMRKYIDVEYDGTNHDGTKAVPSQAALDRYSQAEGTDSETCYSTTARIYI